MSSFGHDVEAETKKVSSFRLLPYVNIRKWLTTCPPNPDIEKGGGANVCEHKITEGNLYWIGRIKNCSPYRAWRKWVSHLSVGDRAGDIARSFTLSRRWFQRCTSKATPTSEAGVRWVQSSDLGAWRRFAPGRVVRHGYSVANMSNPVRLGRLAAIHGLPRTLVQQTVMDPCRKTGF